MPTCGYSPRSLRRFNHVPKSDIFNPPGRRRIGATRQITLSRLRKILGRYPYHIDLTRDTANRCTDQFVEHLQTVGCRDQWTALWAWKENTVVFAFRDETDAVMARLLLSD